MLLIFALVVVPVTAALGVVAVDASMWQSERRGAQKDADLAALAGALELAKKNPDAGDATNATNAATDSSGVNDEAGNASIANLTVDDSCFGVWDYDAVTIDVDHDSRTFFGEMFGVNVAPEIGGHAKACAGAAGSIPLDNEIAFEIDYETSPCFEFGLPVFTKMCGIEYGAHGGPAARGLLDLEAEGDFCSDTQGGVSNTEELIAGDIDVGHCEINTSGTCDPTNTGPWYDCVSIQPTNAQAVLDGTRARIAKEANLPGSPCDPDGNGIHEFDDVVSIVEDTGDPTTSIYEAVDCDPDAEGDQISPRLVTIVVLEEKPSGNAAKGRPIWAFAGFYLVGCAPEVIDPIDENHADLDKECDASAGGGNGGSPPGKTVVYGKFVNLLTAGGGTAPPNDATTMFGISLVE